MEKNWKELWLKNYRGEGETQELASFLKKLNYGNRNNISYLPWAVVERIFRLQDGVIETFPSKNSETQTSIVEADRVLVKEEVDSNGVVSKTYANAYFVNIRVSWQGQTHIERYPLQDSSGRPLSYWTQNDINKAIQRGKVKAIAIISGIGFKLFEDGDLQFTLDGDVAIEKEPDNYGKNEYPYEKQEVEKKPVVKATAVSMPKPIPTPEKLVVKPLSEPTPNRLEQENFIKKEFLSGGEKKSSFIREYLTKCEVKKISDLTDQLLKDLNDIVSKM
jgi:hypothetical protein